VGGGVRDRDGDGRCGPCLYGVVDATMRRRPVAMLISRVAMLIAG
jgi:hypothetical protein